jgi:toxin HigB-1
VDRRPAARVCALAATPCFLIRLTYRVSRVTLCTVIRSYRDKKTRRLAEGERVAAFEGFRHQAEKRLRILESAAALKDLAGLPSNRLEALSGDRDGQYSVRINQQWRICFEWPTGADGPENVEIVDYH